MRATALRRRGDDRPQLPEPAPAIATPSNLQIGRADDRAEGEADRFADSLISDLQARPMSVARSTASVADPLGGTAVSDSIESSIRSTSGGHSLPDRLRGPAETAAGKDLGKVRVHTGRQADELSRSMQATAFTVGSDIFFSDGAYRPGTAAGDHLVAHELGHVVQQGGGTAQRKIRRFLGLGKSKDKAPLSAKPEPIPAFGGKDSSTRRDLLNAIDGLEAALEHLHGRRAEKAERFEDYSAAYLLKEAADTLLHKLPDPHDKSTQVLGRHYPAERRRINIVMGEAQTIYDEYRVAMSKKKFEKVYLESGTKPAVPREGDKPLSSKGGFHHMTPESRDMAFKDVGAQRNEHAEAIAKRVRQNAKVMGLTPAEAAAIATFTEEDYRYMNPATANNMKWMAGMKGKKKADQDGTSLKAEGALHASMAVKGMSQLPVWKGIAYRGQTDDQWMFDKYFVRRGQGPKAKIKITNKKYVREAIVSNSKRLDIAEGFVSSSFADKGHGVPMMFEILLTNGRDIEPLSLKTEEAEVATFPRAEFEIRSAEIRIVRGLETVWVKMRQLK